jgi:hypothetical protein
MQRYKTNRIRRKFLRYHENDKSPWRPVFRDLSGQDRSAPDINTMIKSRRMIRWARNVACVEERKTPTNFWLESLKRRNHSVDPGENGKIILQRAFGMRIGFRWLRIRTCSRLL